MDPSARGSLAPEDFECSYCHERVATDAADKHLYPTLATVPDQTPRTHLHCSELLLNLPEYAAWKTSSKTRLPTKCFGCERERGDPGHEVDPSDEGIVYAVTSVLPYPSVVVYCPKSKEGVQPAPGTEMLGKKGAIEALETRAMASRIEWLDSRSMVEQPAPTRRRQLEREPTVAGPSTAAVTSTAGPSFQSQATMSGQKQATDGKGRAPDSEIATATEGTEGQGIRKSVTCTVQTTDIRLSQVLNRGFPDNLGQRFIDGVGHTSGYAPGPSIGQIHFPGPNVPAEDTPFQQVDEQSDQTHSRCARCCCSKCFCM